MAKHNAETDQMMYLRQQAEDQILQNAGMTTKAIELMSSEEIQETFHELRVHQIELEMQNEELRRIQLELESVREHYFDLYDTAPMGYCTLNANGLILQGNLTGAALLGITRTGMVNQPISRYIHKEDQEIYYLHRKKVCEIKSPQTCELRLVKKDETAFWAHFEMTISHDTSEEPLIRVAFIDISAQKQVEIKLRYLSMHDALTGLLNRGYFEECMDRFERGRQFPISFLMADVDKLKITNDREGHAVGDRLLCHVAELLTHSFRTDDMIARIGGDEFAVLMPNTTSAEAELVLARFRLLLEEHNDSLTEIPLSLSCGISTAEIKAPLNEFLKIADENMYLEKRGKYVT
ncbi:MAG: sensor domain-containing diguanylate cyclase [Spirochaetales bacterium]|nr:sensor domain-containing diguanylate cyclase [Spirochaetales bacterium]